MSSYEAPKNIWQVNSSLQFNEPLDGAIDPRWVNTYAARGETSLHPIAQTLGVDLSKRKLQEAPERGYYLFCGHRGSGKSTELRHLRNELHHPDAYCVVFADAAAELDVNNLRYQDILLHLASKLAAQLNEQEVSIEPLHLRKLYDWFTERVEKRETTRQFAVDSKVGVEGSLSIPLLAKVFGSISTAFSTNSTYKEELRLALQTYFSDFAEAFNHLIQVAQEKVKQRILFIIDGTDRLRHEDAQAFFMFDVHQLQQVAGLFVYCAPVHLAYDTSLVGQNFNTVFHLPMIRVENNDGSRNDNGLRTMREMLRRRAHADLFDAGVADKLIEHCGGHPRDLLKLLQYACSHAEQERFDMASADAAVRHLASDYRRILKPSDYQLLARVDQQQEEDSDRARELLYNLALLEYNGIYYWRSHPIIRTLSAYIEAQQSPEGNG